MDQSIDYTLYEAHRSFPNRVAIVHGTRTCTYEQLHRVICSFASHLIDLGVQPGDKVALWGFGSINWAVAFFSIVRAGGVAVLVNHSLPAEDVADLLRLTDARFLVCGDSVASRGNPGVMHDLANTAGISYGHCVAINTSGYDLVTQYQSMPCTNDLPDRPEDEPAFIIFTSGTTSLPKAVQISHRAIIFDAQSFSEGLEDQMGQTLLCGAPLFHILGLLVCNAYLARGATVILPQNNKPETIASAIAEHGVTDMVSVGATYLSVQEVESFEEDVSMRLKLCMIAGGMSTPVQMMRMELNYCNATFINMYGQSEAAPLTMVHPSDLVELRATSVGRAINGVTLRIVDRAGDDLPFGEVGEVWAQSPGITNGYVGLPPEEQPFDSEGWLHTGDLGYVDENGYLYLSGRMKDIIIRGGENIVPAEIEDELLKVDNIQDAKVLGAPNPVLGESVEACVTLLDKERPLDVDAVRAELKGRLARYKVPSHIFCYDEFPLLASGKLDIQALRASMLNKVLRMSIGQQLEGGVKVFDVVVLSMRYAIPPVSSMLSELASYAGFSSDYTMRVRLAVEEMLAERILDAYSTIGEIRVTFTLWTDWLSISFWDDGVEYFIDKRKETSMNAQIILASADHFHTDYVDGKPVYTMDFVYEQDMDILDFMMRDKPIEE